MAQMIASNWTGKSCRMAAIQICKRLVRSYAFSRSAKTLADTWASSPSSWAPSVSTNWEKAP